MNPKENPTFYAIIPAKVRYDKDLKPNAKLLYGEISALSNKEGYCFASNRYFSKLYDVNKNTISSWISDLHKKGYVSVMIVKEGNEVIERRIGINEKQDTPNHQNLKDINTSNNNTINKLSIKKENFIESVYNLAYAEQILSDQESEKFVEYWSEPNKSQTKMRWELEKTWDLNLRMKRWSRRQKEWNPKKQNSLKSKLNTFNKAKEMMNQINSQ
tara:strand:- start:2713 stop:3357 length:645 start_codon:yes stop_codon:yes gene_type:complete